MNKALFEIGVEDLPPSEYDNIIYQLEDNLKRSFEKNKINFTHFKTFISPRRFGIYIEGLPDKQPDQKEERKGPPKKICFDEKNNPTNALEGFSKSLGIDLEEIKFKNVNGVEYAFAELIKKGEFIKDLLKRIFAEIINNMNFKKPMRWGKGEFSFVRPVHWILALYNKEIIDFELFGKKSSNVTIGHRFFGEKIEIKDIDSFFDILKENYVIPTLNERQERIKNEINTIEKTNNFTVQLENHEDLVEEISKLTEYPSAVLGKFDEKYLFLPQEIATIAIKHHQRSFIAKKNNKLTNYFISFQDGFGREQNVIKGYTRVINARLDDAAFYYEDDLKVDIEKRLAELKDIVYQQGLGNYKEKVERISKLSIEIAQKLNFKKLEIIERAAMLCKIDIPSKIVYEFPELQGIMGKIYLKYKGEKEDVYQTVQEHYKPVSENGEISNNIVANIVSLADKIDDLVGYFGINKIPSGSKDPFGLRRKTFGILRILITYEWDLDLKELLILAEKNYFDAGKSDVSLDGKEEILKDFISSRLETILEKENIPKEASNAVLINCFRPLRSYLSAKAISKYIDKEEFKNFIIAFQRINNISKNHSSYDYEGRLFVEKEEKLLFQRYLEVKAEFEKYIKQLDYEGAILTLVSLKEDIDRYFDNVFVMSQDEAIRINRLGFLKNLSSLFYEIGDIEKLYKG